MLGIGKNSYYGSLSASDAAQDQVYLQGSLLVLGENAEPVLIEIEETEVPLANLPLSYGYWALINLLAAISTVFTALILLVGIFRRRDEEDEEEDENEEENGRKTVPEDSSEKVNEAAEGTEEKQAGEEPKEEQPEEEQDEEKQDEAQR